MGVDLIRMLCMLVQRKRKREEDNLAKAEDISKRSKAAGEPSTVVLLPSGLHIPVHALSPLDVACFKTHCGLAAVVSCTHRVE
jgi:hypothetical protein